MGPLCFGPECYFDGFPVKLPVDLLVHIVQYPSFLLPIFNAAPSVSVLINLVVQVSNNGVSVDAHPPSFSRHEGWCWLLSGLSFIPSVPVVLCHLINDDIALCPWLESVEGYVFILVAIDMVSMPVDSAFVCEVEDNANDV